MYIGVVFSISLVYAKSKYKAISHNVRQQSFVQSSRHKRVNLVPQISCNSKVQLLYFTEYCSKKNMEYEAQYSYTKCVLHMTAVNIFFHPVHGYKQYPF